MRLASAPQAIAACAAAMLAVLAGAARADVALQSATPGVAPDSFAVQAIGAPALQVARPGSLRAASSAMGAFVRNGKLAPGAAVEVTPWDLYFNGATYDEYVRNPWLRTFVNLAASFATVGGAESEPVRSAFALRAVLWDDSDWRLNGAAIACARGVLGAPRPPPDAPPDRTVLAQPELTSEQSAAVRRCRSDNTRWNASQGALGAALTLSTPGDIFQDTRPDGWAGWLSAAFPIGESFQILGSTRFQFRKALPGNPALYVGGLGTRLMFYKGRFVVMLDAGLGAQRQSEETTGRALVGLTAQVLLFGQTWGELGASQDFTLKPDADHKLSITANLKWNYDVAQSLR